MDFFSERSDGQVALQLMSQLQLMPQPDSIFVSVWILLRFPKKKPLSFVLKQIWVNLSFCAFRIHLQCMGPYWHLNSGMHWLWRTTCRKYHSHSLPSSLWPQKGSMWNCSHVTFSPSKVTQRRQNILAEQANLKRGEIWREVQSGLGWPMNCNLVKNLLSCIKDLFWAFIVKYQKHFGVSISQPNCLLATWTWLPQFGLDNNAWEEKKKIIPVFLFSGKITKQKIETFLPEFNHLSQSLLSSENAWVNDLKFCCISWNHLSLLDISFNPHPQLLAYLWRNYCCLYARMWGYSWSPCKESKIKLLFQWWNWSSGQTQPSLVASSEHHWPFNYTCTWSFSSGSSLAPVKSTLHVPFPESSHSLGPISRIISLFRAYLSDLAFRTKQLLQSL